MERVSLLLQPSFYQSSPYATYIRTEEKNDANGLIFYEFIHEIGILIESDIVFKPLDHSTWVLADNADLQVRFHRDNQEKEQFDFIAKSSKGQQLISKLQHANLLQENTDFITLH